MANRIYFYNSETGEELKYFPFNGWSCVGTDRMAVGADGEFAGGTRRGVYLAPLGKLRKVEDVLPDGLPGGVESTDAGYRVKVTAGAFPFPVKVKLWYPRTDWITEYFILAQDHESPAHDRNL
jgi:hypothetical protein